MKEDNVRDWNQMLC